MTESAMPLIRPMTLAELLDRAIRLYRQNFLKFVGIFAIPYIPLMLIQAALSFFSATAIFNQASTNPGEFPFNQDVVNAMFGSFFFLIVQFILVQGLATAALTRAIANNYTGKPISILDSYRALSNSGLKLILALLFVFILLFLLVIWMFIPCVGWFSGPGMLFFLGLVVSPLIAPVITLEKLGVISSVRRAWDLARSRFWWLIGTAFVLTLLGQLIVSGPVYLLNFILQAVASSLSTTVEQQLALTSIAQTLTTTFLSLLYVPLQLTVMTVVYFDLRARSEGLDLAMQLTVSTGSENAALSLPDISEKAPSPLITSLDIGRFALLSLAGIAFYVLIFTVMFAVLGLAMSGF
jgi:hypothetical protein